MAVRPAAGATATRSTGFPRETNQGTPPPRFSGSNRSGHVTNTYGRIKNIMLNGYYIPPSPIKKHLYHLHGLSRNCFRRSDWSRTYSREKPGGGGGYRHYSDEKDRNGAGRATCADVRTPLRSPHPVWRPPSRERSPCRARRKYGGGRDGGREMY